MSIYVNSSKVSDVKEYVGEVATSNLVVNGSEIETAYINGTQVYGLTNSSFTTLFSFSLAPDSYNLENAVSTLTANYSHAFVPGSFYYDIGPGGNGDSRWRYKLRYGYRMVTSDGTFTNDGVSHYLWEGVTVTGADTSHNGGTSCSLQVDTFY